MYAHTYRRRNHRVARTELVRVRGTIARIEDNGHAFGIGGSGGTTGTEIVYERALRRRRELEREIADLERRLGGCRDSPGVAVTKTVTEHPHMS